MMRNTGFAPGLFPEPLSPTEAVHRNGGCSQPAHACAHRALPIATEAAGCCVETVRMALRRLEASGFITRLRPKVVQSVVTRVRRIRFDCAVQTSNAYGFNLKPEENRRIE